MNSPCNGEGGAISVPDGTALKVYDSTSEGTSIPLGKSANC